VDRVDVHMDGRVFAVSEPVASAAQGTECQVLINQPNIPLVCQVGCGSRAVRAPDPSTYPRVTVARITQSLLLS
jgi:hypothetical protein